MQKIKKLSALLLAVVLMLVVMTGCGGGYGPAANPRAQFVQNLNIARRANGYSSVKEDSDLNDAAQEALRVYLGNANGTVSNSDVQYFESQLNGYYIGNGLRITAVGRIVCSAQVYNSGSYDVTGPITRTKGSYIGVATGQARNGQMVMEIVLVG